MEAAYRFGQEEEKVEAGDWAFWAFVAVGLASLVRLAIYMIRNP